jgi:hypothetical protein
MATTIAYSKTCSLSRRARQAVHLFAARKVHFLISDVALLDSDDVIMRTSGTIRAQRGIQAK